MLFKNLVFKQSKWFKTGAPLCSIYDVLFNEKGGRAKIKLYLTLANLKKSDICHILGKKCYTFQSTFMWTSEKIIVPVQTWIKTNGSMATQTSCMMIHSLSRLKAPCSVMNERENIPPIHKQYWKSRILRDWKDFPEEWEEI